ncbi:MAG: alkaline phosphatase family protein [Lachnospiraceae bacterium]|nr:alkaline phosphatase family protein [Lachnospiraceae bacterium]
MKKLFVLSMDAMVWEDVAYLREKPNFSRLMEHMSGVSHVRTIYPSITYPAHVSIMTGCRTGKHGVFTNGTFGTEGGSTRWHYVGDIVKTEDIFAAAKRAGLTTASVFWPVTGRNKNIDYLIDEYFFPDPNETPEQGFANMGSSEEALRAVRENMDRWPSNYKNRGKFLDKTNTFDDFLMGCACSMIRLYQPDVLFVHNCILDTFRHRHGIFNEQIDRGLDMTDEWLGEVMSAMEEAGVYDDTDFVILSDHGQMDFARRIKLNLILRQGGFIDVDESGKVTDWRAFAQSNGMSATIWTKDGAKQQVYEYLCRLRDQGVWGFEEVLTREEVSREYGFDGDFDLVVETDGYTAFGDGWQEPIANPIDLSDYRLGMATHGYRPEKGPQPVFLCKGPSVEDDVMIGRGEIIDEAPTLAATFGGTMPDAEGRVIGEILKQK